MKANYKDKIQKQEAEMSLGNLYDVNKQLMEQAPAMTEAEIQLTKEHLREWVTHNFKQKYLMLLCNELHDYTLFNLDKTDVWAVAKPQTVMDAANDILECMTNRGTLLAFEDQPDGAWEIWIRNPEGCFANYLFPYRTAVIEY